jgi:hypothetical protein
MKAKHISDQRNACVNCGSSVTDTFCPHCGEKVLSDHDHSLWHFISEWFELFFHFDSKFLRTVKLLVIKPGFLTTEYWIGRRVRYMKPFQLLIFLNILYFVSAYVSAHLGFSARVMFPTLGELITNRVYSHWLAYVVQARQAGPPADWQVYQQSFDNHLEQFAKSMVVFLVPMLALILKLLYLRAKKSLLDHFIASFHLISFYILLWSLFLVTMGVAVKICNLVSYRITGMGVFGYLPPIILAVYIFIALRHAYRQSLIIDILSTLLIITVGIQVITQAYGLILFWTIYAIV